MKKYLQEYAAFIRREKLDEYVHKEIKYLQQFDVPLMQFFKHLSAEELFALSKQGAEKLLVDIEKGNAIEEAKKNLDKWKEDKLDGIPRSAVSLKDLTVIYGIQKMSMLELLHEFTSDGNITQNIVKELEFHYFQVQEMALETLESIRREDQEKLLESEEKFKDLFQNSNDLLQFLSPEGNILFTNPAWLDTLGYSHEEVKGKSIYDFVKEDEREYYKNERQKVTSGQLTNVFLKTCYVTKEGKGITLEGYISGKMKDGEFLYSQGLYRNVTERTQQEKQIKLINDQLAEREEDLRQLILHAPDAVIVINTENIITLWNYRAEEIFGWNQDDVIGQNLSDIIVPKAHREAHFNGMKRYLETGISRIINSTVEVPAIHKAGHEIIISITISTTRQGGKQAFIAFLRDITEQKKNELELENQRRRLEKTNNELEQYAWLTSHDLKEPVRKILTFSDALIKRKPGEITKVENNYLNKINDSAKRMSSLIEAVLQYSNVSDEATLFEITDLSITLQEVLDDLELLINSNNAVIEYTTLPVVFAIPVQMRQLFQNLITNALKYRKTEEAPFIKITCSTIEDGYSINIKDNGIGFENIYAQKIFQVFQRLVPGSMYEGTGIGLSLCKKIIETHNGTISAESEPGVGSSFTIVLPKNPLVNPVV